MGLAWLVMCSAFIDEPPPLTLAVAKINAEKQLNKRRKEHIWLFFLLLVIRYVCMHYLRGVPKGGAPGDQHRTAPNAHPTVP